MSEEPKKDFDKEGISTTNKDKNTRSFLMASLLMDKNQYTESFPKNVKGILKENKDKSKIIYAHFRDALQVLFA